MALKNIIGQEKALNILKGSIAKERLAHAYLFKGEDGVGKRLTAINFAKTLNCHKTEIEKIRSWEDKNISTSQPLNFATSRMIDSELIAQIDCCEECPSCLKINKSIHPDVFLIEPEEGQIKVDIIRNLTEALAYKPFEGRYKIAIIDNAETFNQSAANAFLKTLEEPPAQCVLILVSSMAELIPSTILSRCQRVNFSPLPLGKMRDVLKNEMSGRRESINDERAALLGALSGGRPGWALSGDLFGKRDELFGMFLTLLTSAEEDLWEDKNSMQEWFEWVHLWLRDIAVLKATGRTDLLINRDKERNIRDISNKAGLSDIIKLAGALYKVKDSLRFNLNKKVTLYYTHLLLKKTFGF